MENAKLIVSSSPHIKGNVTTKRIMIEVCIALLPALILGTFFFGLYALVIVLTTIASAVISEVVYNLILKKKQTVSDFSAVVTGLILGLNLPPAVPIYVPIVGGIFAIIVVKMLFGGLGKNFANPAAAARIFLLLAWAGQMTKTFVAPISYANGFSEFFKYFAGAGSINGVDGFVSATPLSPTGERNLLYMFLGNIGGCIGETSALALIIGGVYLIIRRIIDWKIPLIFIGTTALFTLIFYGSHTEILPALFGGGLMFGAFFMATDYTTSPNTKHGVIIFGMGLGFLTALLRRFTGMSEGVSYAIVLMNLVSPLLDKYIVPHPFGSGKKPILAIVNLSLICILSAGLLIGSLTSVGIERARVKKFYSQASTQDMFFQKQSDVGKVNAVYKTSDGGAVFNVTGLKGYKKDERNIGYVSMYVLIKDNKVQKVEIYKHDQAVPGGTEHVLTEEYLKAYSGLDISAIDRIELGKDVDAVAQATITSTAIANGVTIALQTYKNIPALVGGAK